MKRMCEVQGIPIEKGSPIKGDVRVRVNIVKLAAALGPKAIKMRRGRGGLVNLYGGAIQVEAFNVRTETVETAPVQDVQPRVEPAADISGTALGDSLLKKTETIEP